MLIPEIYGTATANMMLSKEIINILVILILRETIRKGIALRKAGNKKQLARFISIFIFNTIGILPIIYLAFFQKKKKTNSSK